MDDVVIDEVGKRRLPLWMLSVNSNSDSSEVVPVCEKLNKEEKERMDDTDSSFLVNRGKEERTRRLGRGEKDTGNEGGGGGISIEGGLQKKKRPKKRIEGLGRAVKEAAPLKKCKLKGYEVGNGEEKRASSSSSEEDGELTVDDLMSIAEEYIKKADSGKEHQREATAGPKLDKQVSAASVFFGNESRVSTEASQRSEVPGTTATSSTVSNFTSSIHKDRYHMPKGGQETSVAMPIREEQGILLKICWTCF